MQSANPKDILALLQVISAGLANGVLTEEEIADWPAIAGFCGKYRRKPY